MENIHMNVEMKSIRDNSVMYTAVSGKEKEWSSDGGLCTQPVGVIQSHAGRTFHSRSSSVIFLCLWIVTLLVLIAGLGFHFWQRSIHAKRVNKLQESQSKLEEKRQQLEISTEQEQEKSLAEKNKQLEELAEQLEKNTLELSDKDKQLQLKDEQLREKTAELQEVRTQVESTVKQLNEKNDEISKLIQQRTDLQSELKDVQSRISTDISGLQKQLEDKNKEVQNNMKLLQDKDTQLRRTTQQLEDKERQLLDKVKQLEGKNSDNAKLTQQRTDLQNQLKEVESRSSTQISGLQKQLEEKNKEVQNKMKLLQDKDTQLRRTTQRLEDKERQCLDKIKQLNDKIADNSKLVRNFFQEATGKEGVILPSVWKWIRGAAVDVTLDLNSAHRNLIVSQDRKELQFTETSQNRPRTSETLENWYGVLGKESFSSGRFYYEVQVSQKPCLVVGVVRESINRKENIEKIPDNGFWTIKLMKGAYTAAGDPATTIDIREKPQKVGVYVDYEEGQISFYNVETRSQIYTFTGYNFTEKMYPAFNPCTGTPSVPLIITPVSDET